MCVMFVFCMCVVFCSVLCFACASCFACVHIGVNEKLRVHGMFVHVKQECVLSARGYTRVHKGVREGLHKGCAGCLSLYTQIPCRFSH